MSFFSSAEQRAFHQTYDTLMASAEGALHDPVITTALGDTATGLKVLLDQTFVPNLRYGRLSIPLSHRFDTHIALVPVTSEQGARAIDFTSPISKRFALSWPTDRTYSPFYDIDVSEEIREILRDDDPAEQVDTVPPPTAMQSKVMAYTQMTLGFTEDYATAASCRPLVVVRAEVAKNPKKAAGSILHEYVHVEDLLRDGALQLATSTYQAATELRAYHVSAIVADHPTARKVEALRQAHVDPERPFSPTPELITALSTYGIFGQQ